MTTIQILEKSRSDQEASRVMKETRVDDKIRQQPRFFCSNCNHEIFLSMAFCDECGGEIRWQEKYKAISAKKKQL
jgi:rRNA maturation endonuclease Nob1